MTEFFKEGDLVAIEGKVKFEATNGLTVYVEIAGHFNGIAVDKAAVRTIRPNLQLGDYVTWKETQDRFRVLGVAADEAWIETTRGDYFRKVVPLAEVKRIALVDAAPAAEVAP